jgi:hypothetical protein
MRGHFRVLPKYRFLFSRGFMDTGRLRNCMCTEENRIGGTRKKSRSQKTRAILRGEVHAAHKVLEAQVGVQAVKSRLGFEGKP